MDLTESQVPRVFISYSWDSAEHKERVLELAFRLIDEGIDCHIDQFEPAPPEGWARWMHRQIESADFVLAVGTEIYQRRLEGKEKKGFGLGVTWEGKIITDSIYENPNANRKFIPIVFAIDDKQYISKVFGSVSFYDVSTNQGYDDLYRRLTAQNFIEKPIIGKPRQLPKYQRKSKPNP